jgi:alkylated DNA repair dioxygenase AlkB
MIDYEKLGLAIYKDFISDDEHNSLIEEIRNEISKPRVHTRYSDRNRVLRYGSNSICHNNQCGSIFPHQIDQISEKLVSNKIVKNKPDAININEYLIGDFIVAHADRPESGPIVTILSVNSVATMLFENRKNSKDKFEITMFPKSILQMRDAIRWDWNHSIYPVKETRYSIVFRNAIE